MCNRRESAILTKVLLNWYGYVLACRSSQAPALYLEKILVCLLPGWSNHACACFCSACVFLSDFLGALDVLTRLG